MSYDLCEELIVEIFSRLPTKSLLRFRSLSKSLCACIGSPSFIRLFALRAPKKFMLLHQVGEKGEPDAKHVYTMHPESQISHNPYTVGSCNGIVCVHEYDTGGVHIWNPSIRRKKTIHHLPSLVHGFGFDPITNDYKIVTRSRQSSSIYTMKTDTWHQIASPAPVHAMKYYPCLFNATLHWVGRVRLITDSGSVWHDYILTCDLSSEVFSTIELPEQISCGGSKQVTIIKGCLAVTYCKHYGDSKIWVRRECNNNNSVSCWSLAYKLDTNPFKGVSKIITNDESLCFSRTKGIRVYNLERHIRWKLEDLSDFSRIMNMSRYVESLELLDIGTPCDQ